LKEIFKDCETNSSYENSTIGLNLYTIKDIENFALIDSPGDTENEECLEFFAKKGYIYSKMLIYIMDERKTLDTDSLKNNIKLEALIKLRLNYKIPLLILLTHSDNYCDEIKKTEKNWKDICQKNIKKNKEDLLNHINNNIIKKLNIHEFKFDNDDVLHVVLISPENIEEKSLIELLDEEELIEYNKADEKGKQKILKPYKKAMKFKENEVPDFLKKNEVLGKKELIEKMKEKFPSQYHNTLINIK